MVDYIKRMSLEGKTAYVCGGLGLIGREISKAFEEVGANVVVLDIADKDCVKFDVTKMEKYDKVLNDIFDEHGVLDIWLNASYPRTNDWSNKVENIAVESWKKNIDMQMNSYCLLSIKVREYMKKSGKKDSAIY